MLYFCSFGVIKGEKKNKSSHPLFRRLTKPTLFVLEIFQTKLYTKIRKQGVRKGDEEMPGKSQKLKPDVVLKNYWNNNEQFADLFNGVLYQGKQVIKPEELEDVDTEESTVVEHREYAESIQAARDIIKIQKRFRPSGGGYAVDLVMYGLENQEHIHYGMPLRVMIYDCGTYKKQYDSNAQKYKNSMGMSRDEYLSRMKRDDRFIPVITVVVYYGEKPWDGAVSLHGMLNIPDEIAKYVNDYKMLLVEARENNLTLHNINNIDFFNLLEILSAQNKPAHEKKNQVLEYTEQHKVDSTVLMTVAGASNYNIDLDALSRKGESIMYSVFEETKEEGRMEGRMEGKAEGVIQMGMNFQLSKDQIIEALQKNMDISLQKAEEYFQVYQKQTDSLQ